MNMTGIVRKIDDLGRVVLPIEMRERLNLMGDRQPVEIELVGDAIQIRKATPSCAFCGAREQLVIAGRNQCLCTGCIERMAALAKEQGSDSAK